MRFSIGVAALLAASILPAGTQTAEAAIACNGRYQVMPGGEQVATPYCEDTYLARVAVRSYGISTTAHRIRQSSAEKERVCQMMGHDARISDICLEFRDNRGDRFDK